MLVLTRKRDEYIMIGSDIVIRVIKTGRGNVRIGIEAPASVRVQRGEIATIEMSQANAITAYDEEQFEECTLEALLVQN